jgi:4,5-dihydroxyphthalate decarboxylase
VTLEGKVSRAWIIHKRRRSIRGFGVKASYALRACPSYWTNELVKEDAVKVIGGDYEHTLGLGSTDRAGVLYEPRPVAECFKTVLARGEFEASEFSLANYIIYRCSGDDWLSAVPVFPSRVFRHSHVVVRKDSSIKSFNQLAGKTIGVMDYSQTAAVWLRGLFHEEHGLHWRDVNWVSSKVQRFVTPSGVKITTTEQDIEELLIAGEIDAAMLFPPKEFRKREADRALRTLLPDAKEAEREYFQRTQIFPIMHTVVVRKEKVSAEPNGLKRTFDAYSRAKKNALKRKLGATFLPWSDRNWPEILENFDGDSHPYGLTASNRRVIELLIDYLKEQGFIPNRPTVESLFPTGASEWIE